MLCTWLLATKSQRIGDTWLQVHDLIWQGMGYAAFVGEQKRLHSLLSYQMTSLLLPLDLVTQQSADEQKLALVPYVCCVALLPE